MPIPVHRANELLYHIFINKASKDTFRRFKELWGVHLDTPYNLNFGSIRKLVGGKRWAQGFGSQNSPGDLQPSATPVPGVQHPPLTSSGTYAVH